MLSFVPRYAIGFLDGNGVVTLNVPHRGDPLSYRSGHVILVNPLGGYDNWTAVSRWVRETAGTKVRRQELAGLASERRPDDEANDAMLRDAAAGHGRAIVLPPDEGFSAARAAEVNYIYGIPIATLQAWRRTHRAELSGSKPGRPRRKPVRTDPPA